ncbi:MAG: hypothetical protein ACREH5_01080, partial [Candidatus Omnitrophota bacterium]
PYYGALTEAIGPNLKAIEQRKNEILKFEEVLADSAKIFKKRYDLQAVMNVEDEGRRLALQEYAERLQTVSIGKDTGRSEARGTFADEAWLVVSKVWSGSLRHIQVRVELGQVFFFAYDADFNRLQLDKDNKELSHPLGKPAHIGPQRTFQVSHVPGTDYYEWVVTDTGSEDGTETWWLKPAGARMAALPDEAELQRIFQKGRDGSKELKKIFASVPQFEDPQILQFFKLLDKQLEDARVPHASFNFIEFIRNRLGWLLRNELKFILPGKMKEHLVALLQKYLRYYMSEMLPSVVHRRTVTSTGLASLIELRQGQDPEALFKDPRYRKVVEYIVQNRELWEGREADNISETEISQTILRDIMSLARDHAIEPVDRFGALEIFREAVSRSNIIDPTIYRELKLLSLSGFLSARILGRDNVTEDEIRPYVGILKDIRGYFIDVINAILADAEEVASIGLDAAAQKFIELRKGLNKEELDIDSAKKIITQILKDALSQSGARLAATGPSAAPPDVREPAGSRLAAGKPNKENILRLVEGAEGEYLNTIKSLPKEMARNILPAQDKKLRILVVDPDIDFTPHAQDPRADYLFPLTLYVHLQELKKDIAAANPNWVNVCLWLRALVAGTEAFEAFIRQEDESAVIISNFEGWDRYRDLVLAANGKLKKALQEIWNVLPSDDRELFLREEKPTTAQLLRRALGQAHCVLNLYAEKIWKDRPEKIEGVKSYLLGAENPGNVLDWDRLEDRFVGHFVDKFARELEDTLRTLEEHPEKPELLRSHHNILVYVRQDWLKPLLKDISKPNQSQGYFAGLNTPYISLLKHQIAQLDAQFEEVVIRLDLDASEGHLGARLAVRRLDKKIDLTHRVSEAGALESFGRFVEQYEGYGTTDYGKNISRAVDGILIDVSKFKFPDYGELRPKRKREEALSYYLYGKALPPVELDKRLRAQKDADLYAITSAMQVFDTIASLMKKKKPFTFSKLIRAYQSTIRDEKDFWKQAEAVFGKLPASKDISPWSMTELFQRSARTFPDEDIKLLDRALTIAEGKVPSSGARLAEESQAAREFRETVESGGFVSELAFRSQLGRAAVELLGSERAGEFFSSGILESMKVVLGEDWSSQGLAAIQMLERAWHGKEKEFKPYLSFQREVWRAKEVQSKGKSFGARLAEEHELEAFIVKLYYAQKSAVGREFAMKFGELTNILSIVEDTADGKVVSLTLNIKTADGKEKPVLVVYDPRRKLEELNRSGEKGMEITARDVLAAFSLSEQNAWMSVPSPVQGSGANFAIKQSLDYFGGIGDPELFRSQLVNYLTQAVKHYDASKKENKEVTFILSGMDLLADWQRTIVEELEKELPPFIEVDPKSREGIVVELLRAGAIQKTPGNDGRRLYISVGDIENDADSALSWHKAFVVSNWLGTRYTLDPSTKKIDFEKVSATEQDVQRVVDYVQSHLKDKSAKIFAGLFIRMATGQAKPEEYRTFTLEIPLLKKVPLNVLIQTARLLLKAVGAAA